MYDQANGTNTDRFFIAESPEQAAGLQAEQAAAPADELAVLKAKYGKLYEVALTLQPDDDTELTMRYCFKKATTSSFDRYVKGVSNSSTKAMKMFVLDNIVKEHEARYLEDIEEYPGLVLSVGGKLLDMLGVSRDTNLTRL